MGLLLLLLLLRRPSTRMEATVVAQAIMERRT
jgi:hypothetical protein